MQKVIPSISISTKKVGVGCPIFIIAEAGVNHNGDLSLAKKLVDAAVEVGADAIKFQTFKSEDICTPDATQAGYQVKNTNKKESQLEMIKRLELSKEDHYELKKHCDQKKIIFCSTPHSSTKDVDFLDPLVPFFKIASGDLTNLLFLSYIAKKRKPLFLSTGMGTLEEVKEAYGCILKEDNPQLLIMHATSNYPFLPYEANLRAMQTLQQNFPVLIGYSDNGNRFDVPLLTALMGAVAIEKHLTLDKNLEGPDHQASFDPQEFSLLVKGIRLIEQELTLRNSIPFTTEQELTSALKIILEKLQLPKTLNTIPLILGDGVKKSTKNEQEIAKVARKSLVYAKDIAQGTTLKQEDFVIKRPGIGLSPTLLYYKSERVIGKKLRHNVKHNQLVFFEDFL